jgi:hypothetical protein
MRGKPLSVSSENHHACARLVRADHLLHADRQRELAMIEAALLAVVDRTSVKSDAWHLRQAATNSSSPLMLRKLSGCPAKLASGRSDHPDGMKSGSFLKWIAPTRGRIRSSR